MQILFSKCQVIWQGINTQCKNRFVKLDNSSSKTSGHTREVINTRTYDKGHNLLSHYNQYMNIWPCYITL